jgi:hypothetical protein
MAGKPCSFKAVCDGYCKKHSGGGSGVTTLGKKVNLTKIKIND